MNNKLLSVILLAGGQGSRFGEEEPKQYFLIGNKRVVIYSFECFGSMQEISEMIIVCHEDYRSYFPIENYPHIRFQFASPGQRRQDSVFNGLQKIEHTENFVCIHDSARPVIDPELVRRVHQGSLESNAATAGMPIKFTVKKRSSEGFVTETLDRSSIWEIQTPQIVSYPLLKKGFHQALNENLTVTDDVSLVELMGGKVNLVEGSYKNIKITTKEDLIYAENFLGNLAHA